MLKIRFTQTGKKNDHVYRLVVKETRSKRDGDAVEFLGYYQPRNNDGLKINSDRLNYWLTNGAQLSPSAKLIVASLIESQPEKEKTTKEPKSTAKKNDNKKTTKKTK